MLKNNSNVPAAYVSPAVKWVNARTRGVVCTSPVGPTYGGDNEAGDVIHTGEDDVDF